MGISKNYSFLMPFRHKYIGWFSNDLILKALFFLPGGFTPHKKAPIYRNPYIHKINWSGLQLWIKAFVLLNVHVNALIVTQTDKNPVRCSNAERARSTIVKLA